MQVGSYSRTLKPYQDYYMMQGLTFLNEHCIITTLGRGSFGEVKLALNTLDMEVYALKLIMKSKRKNQSAASASTTHTAEASVMSEINVMKELSHPNLVKLVEVIGETRPVCTSFSSTYCVHFF